MNRMYAHTVLTDSPWKRIDSSARNLMTTGLWLATWALLLLGYQERLFWEALVVFSVAHALFAWVMVGFRTLVFPAQLRIAYAAWVALGTYVPELYVMMPITTIGLAALLVANYCPLARMLYLLPWNRTLPLTSQVLIRAFTQPPRGGRFAVYPEGLPGGAGTAART